jgi:hypothetical protein
MTTSTVVSSQRLNRILDHAVGDFTVTVEAGITLDSDSESSGIVTAWLSGGTANTVYDVACKIVTSASRTDERTIKIKVLQR